MASLSIINKELVSKRGKNLFLSSDYYRKYRNIAKEYSNYIMEESLHFIESYGVFIFHNILSDDLSKMFK